MSEAVAADHVVLVDEDGCEVGIAPRETVHHARTPLHLAFSCYLFRADGQVLLTRRALGKRSWPGVWTNSFCGHPRPGEAMRAAVERHAMHELGISVRGIRTVLPSFRYRACDSAGVVENELCPVHVAVTDDEPAPNAGEVMDVRWVAPVELDRLIDVAPWVLSPWSVEQVRAMPGGTSCSATPPEAAG